VDEQVALVGQLAERVAELPDGVGVELAHRAAHGVAVGLVYLDVEHELLLPGTRSGDGSGVPPPCRPPSPDRRRPVAEPPPQPLEPDRLRPVASPPCPTC